MKIIATLIATLTLASCMWPAGEKPVLFQAIKGDMGIIRDKNKLVSMQVPSGSWLIRQQEFLDFSNPNYGAVNFPILKEGSRIGPLSIRFEIEFKPFGDFQASEFIKKSRTATMQGIDPNVGTPMESYLKRLFIPTSEENFNTVVSIRRFDVGQYRCLQHVYSRFSGRTTKLPLSYTADISCPFFYQGKEATVKYTLNVYSREKLGEGVDAAKYRLDEILPSIELAVKSSVFSKEFSQQIPNGYLPQE